MPCLLYEARMFVTPWENRFRLGGTMEFSGYNDDDNPLRLASLYRRAAEYLQVPTGADLELEWHGWRPMTPDGVPFIDRSPRYDNVWVAAGHNMLGISMAPGTGQYLAGLLSGQTSPLPAYGLSRKPA